ncbi:hypothetical protein D3C71_1625780 [compost metagenome]
MGHDRAAAVGQKGKAVGCRADGRHIAHHGRQQHIGADHGRGIARGPDRLGKGHPDLGRRSEQVGRGHDGLARAHRLLVPGTRRHVIAFRHGVEKNRALVGKADIGVGEATAIAQRLHHAARVRLVYGQRQRMGQQAFRLDPVAERACLGQHQLPALDIDGAAHMALHREKVGRSQGQHGHRDDGNAERDETGSES